MLKRINKQTLKLGGIIMALSYFPQIYQVLTTGSSEGISLAFITMVSLALATFSFNGYIVYKDTGEIGTFLSQLANLIPALILVVLIIITRLI